MTFLSVMEWMGCALGVLGALLLATNTRWSPFGWVVFLASNVFWIGYAMASHAEGLLAQQFVFTGTSLLGVYRWLLPSKRSAKMEEIHINDA